MDVSVRRAPRTDTNAVAFYPSVVVRDLAAIASAGNAIAVAADAVVFAIIVVAVGVTTVVFLSIAVVPEPNALVFVSTATAFAPAAVVFARTTVAFAPTTVAFAPTTVVFGRSAVEVARAAVASASPTTAFGSKAAAFFPFRPGQSVAATHASLLTFRGELPPAITLKEKAGSSPPLNTAESLFYPFAAFFLGLGLFRGGFGAGCLKWSRQSPRKVR